MSIECLDTTCKRTFLSVDPMLDHAQKVHDTTVEEAREFTAKQRKQAAAKGQARSDGSFPIQNAQDLRNAIQALGRAKNKAGAKAHIIRRARALGLTKLLPNGWVTGDSASADAIVDCPDCARLFVSLDSFVEHAEAVHTFDDIRRLVSEAVREKYGRQGDYQALPPRAAIWVWVDDLADDWVVFQVEEGTESTLYKASYSITDATVTLGEPDEVRRRTVYDVVKKG